ncbi:hypothetical protein FHX73_1839 [Kitasatospora viridis]|uniref:HTH cro/C1-type domain-containing protein n=2 Tax=Kitasatospora viridis TaxID=281105 RepID=A0A561S9W6_9ACTN|nr:hypothetical protein FHX73_1839 [Kitasatospora viridis]
MTELAATLKSEGRSAEEIAEAVAQQAVKSVITGQYIGQLVSGAADNPTRIRMQCLAEFFDMDPSFFFDGEKAAMMDRELEMLQLLKNPHVRTLARAADRLDKSGLAAVLAIMGHMKVAPQVSVPDEDDQARPDGS